MDEARTISEVTRLSTSMRLAPHLVLFALALMSPAIVQASAAPPPVVHARDPMPTIAVEGDLQVTRGEITVSCGLVEFVDAWATCSIEATLRLSTDGGARLTREPLAMEPPPEAVEAASEMREHVAVIVDAHPDDVVLLGGRPFTGTLALGPGMSRTLVIRATRELHGAFDSNDYLVFSAPVTRHPLLSESHAFAYSNDAWGVELLRGDFAVTGPVRLDARNTTGLEVKLGERRVNDVCTLPLGREPIALSVALHRDRDHEGPVANGGLALLGATRENLDREEGERALVAVEYAVVLHDFVFASASIATDFDSVFESLVLEVATPDLIFLIPSLSAGLGVVVRELDDRNADAALRARFIATWPMLGLQIDLDYWPDLGQWTSTLGLRVGL